MFDIKELAVIDKIEGYCGCNVAFETIKTDKENNKVAIVAIERQPNEQDYCASLYILLPNNELINARKCFVEDTHIINNNKRLQGCIKNFGYKENQRFNTCYDLCDFVNIENNVYLCFHRSLGRRSEQSPTIASYIGMIGKTYNDVVSAILEVFRSYCSRQLVKKKIECFDKILQEKPAGFFLGHSAVQEYTDYHIKLYILYKHSADTYNIKTKKLQSQRILYDREKYKVNGSFS